MRNAVYSVAVVVITLLSSACTSTSETATASPWKAKANATATARAAKVTAIAPSANATATARAASAVATATSVGILVSAPAEVRKHYREPPGDYRWTWTVKFEETAGRAISIDSRETRVYTLFEGLYHGSQSLSIEIPAYGRGTHEYWVQQDASHTFDDATCVLTFSGVDENGNQFEVQTVIRLKGRK